MMFCGKFPHVCGFSIDNLQERVDLQECVKFNPALIHISFVVVSLRYKYVCVV
jgi:hypothetical protein